jgi:hypothetical protein
MTRKPKAMTVSKAKKLAWTAFSIYIRTRDCLETTGCASWGLCITCGKRYHIKLLQAGHFIAGRHNGGLFSERGVHSQCYNCNINLKGNTLVYRRKIIEKYGADADTRLEIEAAQIRQFKTYELIEMAKRYREMTKELTHGKVIGEVKGGV